MAVAEAIGAAALGFALGSVPTAYIVGRWRFGVDIRGLGGGNPGATNTAEQLGKRYGGLVLAADAGKGALAVLAAQWIGAPDIGVYSAAFASVLGHNFSPFLGFRGGKGAATALGVSMLMLWQLTAASMVAGIAAFAVARNVVWAMAGVFIALNGLTILTGQSAGQIALCLAISGLVTGTHFARERRELGAAMAKRDWRRFMRTR